MQIAALVVVPIQENQGYAIGFGIPTICFGAAIFVFVMGFRLYVRMPPEGSPFTRIYKVFAAAHRNRKLPVPEDDSLLYQTSAQDESSVKFRWVVACEEVLLWLACVRPNACPGTVTPVIHAHFQGRHNVWTFMSP